MTIIYGRMKMHPFIKIISINEYNIYAYFFVSKKLFYFVGYDFGDV